MAELEIPELPRRPLLEERVKNYPKVQWLLDKYADKAYPIVDKHDIEAVLTELLNDVDRWKCAYKIMKINFNNECDSHAADNERNEKLITELNKQNSQGELKMFKDELIALQKKANPRKDISPIVAEFKEEIKSWVKNGFCKNDNKVTFDIVSGGIICKNPLYHEPTCYIEDLSAVEKVFKKEGIDMEWTYDRTHLNGTLTFRW